MDRFSARAPFPRGGQASYGRPRLRGCGRGHHLSSKRPRRIGNRVSRTYNLSAYDAQVQVALELWGSRVMGLVAGERKPAKVLALRRRKGA